MATRSDHRLTVGLRDARLPRGGRDVVDGGGSFRFRDDWPWRFEVFDPHGESIARGVRESQEEAMDAAIRKADEIPPALGSWPNIVGL